LKQKTVFFPGVFLRAVCAAGHLRGLASFPAPGFLPLAGVNVMLCDPWPRSGRLLWHFCFSSSFPRASIPAEKGYVKAGTQRSWGGRASARALTWPRRDYIAPPEEEEKRRSNRLSPRGSQGSRQRRTPARIRQASWCLRGKTGPGAGPGSTQPGSKRPIERQRSVATYEGCGGTLPPRCTASPGQRHQARACPACTRSASYG